MAVDPLDDVPETKSYGEFVVEIGDGATPEAFKAPCGFDSKSLNLSASTSEANIPRCSDPDAPGWTARGVSAFSGEVQGSGVMAVEDGAMWSSFFLSGKARTVRVTVSEHEIYTGKAVCTALGTSAALGSNGKLVQRSITLQSNGPWVNTVAGA